MRVSYCALKKGDTVLRGQPLTFGRGRMLPIHAPDIGKVVAITPHTVASVSPLRTERHY